MNRIFVNIDAYLNDCPPWDEPIDESIVLEIAEEIARRFDCTEVYGQIDDLACALLRERNPLAGNGRRSSHSRPGSSR